MRALERVRELLAMPDILATPQARILHVILRTLLICTLLFIPLVGFLFPLFFMRTLGSLGVLCVACPGLMLWAKRGQVRSASWALVIGLFFLQVYFLPSGGGMGAPGLMTFLLISLIGGVLLGSRPGWFIFGLCLAYTLGVAVVQERGGLPAPAVVYHPLNRWAYFALMLSVMLGLQRLFSREVAQAMEVLKESQDELEQRVQVRTAELAKALGELTQRNEELALAKDQAQRATEAKDRFLSIVSHELRSPLTSVRGSLVLLRGGIVGTVPPEGQAMLDIAERNTHRLLGLVDELLDHQKVEAGAFEVAREPMDLRAVLHKAVDGMNGAASVAGATLILEEPPRPLILEGDPRRLEQVLVNLLANAVAHGKGDRRIRVSTHEGPGRLRVEVANEGDPIPEVFQARLFQPFQQAGSGRVGTGLGLFLSKAIVEAHGGRLDFTSGPDGTVFHFELPTAGGA